MAPEQMTNLFPTQTKWVEEFSQIHYGPHNDQSLDLYRPPVRRSKDLLLPTVVFMHGGAWLRKGQREASAARLARQLVITADVVVVVVGYSLSRLKRKHFVALGFIFATLLASACFVGFTATPLAAFMSVQSAQLVSLASFCAAALGMAVCWRYRYACAPVVKFPQQPHDCAAALDWVVQNIERHGGDPRCITLAGHSAGAHLASLIAIDSRFIQSDSTIEQVRGFIAISGVYDSVLSTAESVVGGSCMWHWGVQLVWQLLLEIVFGTDPDNWPDAFPTMHAREKSEGFNREQSALLITAEHELVGLQQQADQFAEELTVQGYWVQQLVVKGTNHLSIMNTIPNPEPINDPVHPVVQAMTQFVKQTIVQRKLCIL